MAIVAREEGFGALYKGLTPKVMRLGPGGAIMLVVYDYVYEFLDGYFKWKVEEDYERDRNRIYISNDGQLRDVLFNSNTLAYVKAAQHFYKAFVCKTG